MDEPLSNLDAKLRVAMRAELARLHERLGVTTIYVTHDQVEAMTLGERVAVLRDGVLQQVDTPQTLFDAPANMFVAAFIGSPAMNLVAAEVVARRRRVRRPRAAAPTGLDVTADRAIVGIRPYGPRARRAGRSGGARIACGRGGRASRRRGARHLPARRSPRRG